MKTVTPLAAKTDQVDAVCSPSSLAANPRNGGSRVFDVNPAPARVPTETAPSCGLFV